MKRRISPLLFAAAAFALFVPGMFGAPKPTQAMPTFAQAYGLKCSACHTMVPSLNAYGRYVQRTGYAALDRAVLDKAVPIWVDEAVNYDSSQSKQVPNTTQWDPANLAIHAVGYAAPDVTYHVQQWIVQDNQSGGLDTLWAAYSKLFNHDGHLFVGKLENPAPSVYSQDFELDGPLASATVVGEHDWSATLYGNRWGTKLAYTPKNLDIEASWLFSSDDLNGFSDFNPGDKTFQWKVAYAQPKQPIEVGLFGSNGALPVSTGIDQYNSIAGYLQIDPNPKRYPGLLFIYQSGLDKNPGIGVNGTALPETGSQGLSVGLYESFFQGNVMLGARHDLNNSGPNGQVLNGESINVGFNVPYVKYLHGYVETNLGSTSSWYGGTGAPTYKGMLWLTIPVATVNGQY